MLVVAQKSDADADQRGGDNRHFILRRFGCRRHQGQRRPADRADSGGKTVQAVNEVHGLGDPEDPEHRPERREPVGERYPVRGIGPGGHGMQRHRRKRVRDAVNPHVKQHEYPARRNQRERLPDGRDFKTCRQ